MKLQHTTFKIHLLKESLIALTKSMHKSHTCKNINMSSQGVQMYNFFQEKKSQACNFCSFPEPVLLIALGCTSHVIIETQKI